MPGVWLKDLYLDRGSKGRDGSPQTFAIEIIELNGLTCQLDLRHNRIGRHYGAPRASFYERCSRSSILSKASYETSENARTEAGS